MRLAFMGTPPFAARALQALIDAGHEVACVYSQPPRPAGRGHKLVKSAVQTLAEAHGIAVRTPARLRPPEEHERFAALDLDVAVVAAYGLILPQAILDAPRHGCINIHGSLLPRWRGAAPIHRAIMAGDRETGVMVMKMDEGLDTGPIALELRVPIGPDATTGALHDELARRGAKLLPIALGALERGSLTLTPQAATGATYAAKIDKSETRIDWTQAWQEVHNHCRGLSPIPGAWFELAGSRIKVLRTAKGDGEGRPGTVLDDRLTIACGKGAVRIVELQRAGGKPMAAEEFLRGTAVAPASLVN